VRAHLLAQVQERLADIVADQSPAMAWDPEAVTEVTTLLLSALEEAPRVTWWLSQPLR
jgi:hypothetical protein